jgi:hypothetical protein
MVKGVMIVVRLITSNIIEHKYSLICDTCGGNYPRHRKPRIEYSCAKCEPNRFNSKYLLRVEQNF